MHLTRILCLSVLAIGLIPASNGLIAQGTVPDYVRATGLRDKYAGLVVNVSETPRWIERTNRLWCRKTVVGGHEFLLVDRSEEHTSELQSRLPLACPSRPDSKKAA